MTTPRPSPDPGKGFDRYVIRVHGRLDPRWSTWFDGVTLAHDEDGGTVLRCQVPDQAALHGLLHRIRDMGLPLISVAPEHADSLDDVHPTQEGSP
jgi:hypothetical protein